MDIYILHKGQESGPYSEKAVAQLLDQGSIAPSDFAWRQGWPDWRPLSEFITVETTPETDLPKADGGEEKPPVGKEKSPAVEERPLRGKEAPVPAKEKDIKAAESAEKPKKQEEGAPLAEPVKSADPAEPASAKQKALLTFLRITLPAELTKDKAARMINDVMEDPQHARRLSQWNEERFRLHPELFAAEIQAKKENRANHFFELCQTNGSEYFNGISKAHCQVLVSFLDVTYPHWDASEEDAAEHYFFPAVAEKFPQLVQKQWRGRLQYSDGVKVAAEIVKKSGTTKIRQTRTSPAAAVLKGTVIGLVILGALYLGHRTLRQEANAAPTGEQPSPVAQNPAPGPAASAPSAPGPSLPPPPGATAAPPSPTDTTATIPPAMTTAASVPEAPAEASSVPAPAVAVASVPAPSASPAMGDSNGAAPMTSPSSGEPPVPVAPPAPTLPVAGSLPTTTPPPTPMGSSDLAAPVLGPDPTNAGSAPTAPAAANAPAAPVVGPAPASTTAAKINLLLTRPVEIQLAYGKIMLPPGTPVKLMSRQGYLLKVSYQNSVITVPVGSTDLE